MTSIVRRLIVAAFASLWVAGAATPVTIPVVPTVAAASPPSQLPPVTASPKSVVLPTQTLNVPVIGEGVGLTVNTVVAIHPFATL